MSMRWRLLFSHWLVTLIALLVFLGVGVYWSYHTALQDLEHSLEDGAVTLAGALEDHWNEYYEHNDQSRLAAMTRLVRHYSGQHAAVELTLLLPDGTVLLRSTAAPQGPLSVTFDPQGAAWQAMIRGEQEEWEFTATTPWGERRFYVFWRVAHEDRTLGVLLLEAPVALVWGQVQRDLRWMLLGAGGVLLFAGLVAWGLARSLTRPLENLAEGVVRFSRGEYAWRAPLEGPAEVRRLAHALNEMAARLEIYIRDLRAFVAYAGHELRTPITAIKLRLEALREGNLDDPQRAQRYLAEAEAETDRLGRILGELLDLSRLDAGETTGTRELVDLYRLAQEVVDFYRLLAEQQQVHLELQAEPGLVSVWAHPEEMRRALVNLVDNALKYTPAGGRVTVFLAPRGQAIRVEVRDTGPGIPPEDLPHLFNRFYRGRNARPGGTGLGLAMVRAIVEAHHGRVGVSSRLGEGSRFWMEIPVRPPRFVV